jgi:HTH-type transcriptional regulator / antitoxin HipB
MVRAWFHEEIGFPYWNAYKGIVYAFAYNSSIYAIAHIDVIYAIAYICVMDTIARTTRQLGSSLRRIRRQKNLTQDALADLMHVRQATVSKLEAGEPATQLRVLVDALSALDLELVIRPRTTVSADDIENLF